MWSIPPLRQKGYLEGIQCMHHPLWQWSVLLYGRGGRVVWVVIQVWTEYGAVLSAGHQMLVSAVEWWDNGWIARVSHAYS